MKKVMIVDDEPDTVDAVKSILQSYGFESIEARSGKECLDKLKKTIPDLILLDIMMPGMTARGVVKKLKKNKRTKNIKIIYLTAVGASEEEKEELKSLGHVVDYIEKPFDVDDLVNRIKQALG